MNLDGSVYPDLDHPPNSLNDEAERADYLLRICAAWDYGIVPVEDTIALMKNWAPSFFDRHRLVHSPAYHALRWCLGLAPLPLDGFVEGSEVLLVEPDYLLQDRREGRSDPCEALV